MSSLSVLLQTVTGQKIPVTVSPYDTTTPVSELKVALEKMNGAPPSFQRLVFNGAELQDESAISSYGIQNGSIVHLILRTQQTTAQPPPQQQAAHNPYPQQQVPAGNVMHMNAAYVVNVAPPPAVVLSGESERKIRLCFQLGRAVKLFSIIDTVFLIIWSFVYWELIFAVALAICGYYGAHYYKKGLIYAFMFYIVISIIGRIYWGVVEDRLGYRIIILLAALIEMYILRLVYRFEQILRRLSDEELGQLLMLNRAESIVYLH